jgi:hypothetical protein
MSRSLSPTNLVKLALIATALAVFTVSCLQHAEERTPVPLTASETPTPVPARSLNTDFGTFSHDVPEHKQFACDSCHRRGSGQEINLAGHEACIGCHLSQFTVKEGPICAICHQETQSSPPPVRAFPAKFEEGFNMKFDHAAHERGEGRPAEGCVSCHEPRGPGKAIPIGIRAHANCYTCHTPDKQIGACNTCHELAPYNRTPQSRYLFTIIFSHADHSAAQGVSCNECHDVRPGAPQSRQVSLPIAFEHPERKANPGGVNCLTCHNGARAFGGGINDFANCSRCHTRDDFKVF